jgi:hypothetical protein
MRFPSVRPRSSCGTNRGSFRSNPGSFAVSRLSRWAADSAEQLWAVVPLADFIIFRNHVCVTEGMQEPA